MKFIGGFGENEFLWVRRVAPHRFEVITTPVYVYGISPGAVVTGEVSSDTLVYSSIVRVPSGLTIRILCAPGERASAVYAGKIIPAAQAADLKLGIATILDPRMVAIHVRDGRERLTYVSQFFDALQARSVVKQWELADPDREIAGSEDDNSRARVTLVHPPLA